MKKIINFIENIWNKFINIFTKKYMSLQTDIDTDIKDYIKANRANLVYINNISYSLLVSHTPNPNNTHEQKVIINFSLSGGHNIETVVNFNKIKNIHIVEITEGNSNLNGMSSLMRKQIYDELDLMNNILKNTHYAVRYKFHHT
jgi:hypothetical protein